KAGLFLVARGGPIELQAQRGPVELHGRDVRVVSQQDWVHIEADDELVLQVPGARLRLSDAGIEIDTDGSFTAEAAEHVFDGPAMLRQLLQPAEQRAPIEPGHAVPVGPQPAGCRLRRIVPVVFLPGIMGSHLRLARQRQEQLGRRDNRAWRPDDLGAHTLLGFGDFGRFLKKATARQRQLNFDPEATELDRYEGTDDPEHFEARAFDDARHGNVLRNLEVEPVLVQRPQHEHQARFELLWPPAQRELSGARKARRRGWSEVHQLSYGRMLQVLEEWLNTLRRRPCDSDGSGQPATRRVHNLWLPFDAWDGTMSLGGHTDLGPVGVPPRKWGRLGAAPPPALQPDDVLQLADTAYPVHAMGYNWLRPNADSARSTAQRIRALIAHYAKLGGAQGAGCEHVLLITHSMGGLVARALVHPDIGALGEQLGGVMFNAMPTHGAAATYKRLRAGMSAEGGWLDDTLINPILGSTARDMVPVVANASGPLELFPAGDYGDDWLRVQWVDARGQAHEQVLDVQRAIEDPDCWWRVVNPEWVNPARRPLSESSVEQTRKRVVRAAEFHAELAGVSPVTNSHSSYAADPDRKSWGVVTWRVKQPLPEPADPDPTTWTPAADDARGCIRVRSGDVEFELELLAPQEPGDGTVPAQRSGAKAPVAGVRWEQQGYEHQGSCNDRRALSAALYAMVRMDQARHS
ncbi:MAG: DUF2345 domain-containing protein, partial [Betaproteobacteria bacterium]|nr:DUF2345 domain-containing protein [Betaproteobacteria bacterium]